MLTLNTPFFGRHNRTLAASMSTPYSYHSYQLLMFHYRQEQYFGAILQSADVFPVLQVKVQEGLRFFSQLKDKVTKLLRRTSDICDHQQRKREAVQR